MFSPPGRFHPVARMREIQERPSALVWLKRAVIDMSFAWPCAARLSRFATFTGLHPASARTLLTRATSVVSSDRDGPRRPAEAVSAPAPRAPLASAASASTAPAEDTRTCLVVLPEGMGMRTPSDRGSEVHPLEERRWALTSDSAGAISTA